MNNVPIFPLPNVVLLPGVKLPLHIFEDKYKSMINEIAQYDYNIIISYALMDNKKLLPRSVNTIGEVQIVKEYPDGRKDIVVEGTDYIDLYETTKNDPYLVAAYGKRNVVDQLDSQLKNLCIDRILNLIKQFALINFNFSSKLLHFYFKQTNFDHLLNSFIFYNMTNQDLMQEFLEILYIEDKFNFVEKYILKLINTTKQHIKSNNLPASIQKNLN